MLPSKLDSLKIIFNNPHRFPINLVDSVIKKSDVDIVTQKFITANDYFFKDKKFVSDDDFFYSELLVLESFMQSAGLFIEKKNNDKIPYVISFKGIVVLDRPTIGSAVQHNVRLLSRKSNVIIVSGSSKIDNQIIMEYKDIYIGC
jgi:hypothetical protein